MTIKSGVIERFEEYSQFACLEEFNHHLEMWMEEYKHEFSKGELVGLKRLSRFAAKVPGVCNAKIGTILKAIHEEYHNLGISRSTFKRMIIKSRNLGIFTVHETERKNGSQSSNLYVFNRFPNNEPPKQEKMNHHNKTIIPSKTNIKKINKREEKPSFEKNSDNTQQATDTETVLKTTDHATAAERTSIKTSTIEKAPEDHLFVSDRVPAVFVDLVKYFFPKAKAIEEFWRMSMITAYRNNCENEAETLLTVSMDSFRQLVRKLKTTAAVKNPIAYFTGILNKKFQEIYFAELFEMGFDGGNSL
jgi:hypothetical protein